MIIARVIEDNLTFQKRIVNQNWLKWHLIGEYLSRWPDEGPITEDFGIRICSEILMLIGFEDGARKVAKAVEVYINEHILRDVHTSDSKLGDTNTRLKMDVNVEMIGNEAKFIFTVWIEE